MYARRYYAASYFAPRYFGEGGAAAVTAGGYFGRRYFGASYFGPRYFSIRAGATPPPVTPEAPGGGAGRGMRGGRRRYFRFLNPYDDPEAFIEPVKEPKKEPEPVAQQPYVEGDPVAPAAGMSSLGYLGAMRTWRPQPSAAKLPLPATPVEEELPPLTDAEEHEEELLVLRMLGVL